MTNFESFGVAHIPGIKIYNGNKNVETNIFRIQIHDSIIFSEFCIRFIYFMLGNKRLKNFTSLLLSYDFDETIKKYLNIFNSKMYDNGNLK